MRNYLPQQVLLTKNEIMKIWNESNTELNDFLCCPHCRDNLRKDTFDGVEAYYCANNMCDNRHLYQVDRTPEKMYKVVGDIPEDMPWLK